MTMNWRTLRETAALLGAMLLGCVPQLAMAEVRLTAKVIESWMAAMPDVEAFGVRHEQALEAVDGEDQGFMEAFDVESMVKPLKQAGLYDEVADLVARHGFDSPEAWAEVTGRITRAGMALEYGDGAAFNEAEIEAQWKAMANNPEIPPEALQLYQRTMDQARSMAKMIKETPEADKDAVRPYVSRLKKILDMDEAGGDSGDEMLQE